MIITNHHCFFYYLYSKKSIKSFKSKYFGSNFWVLCGTTKKFSPIGLDVQANQIWTINICIYFTSPCIPDKRSERIEEDGASAVDRRPRLTLLLIPRISRSKLLPGDRPGDLLWSIDRPGDRPVSDPAVGDLPVSSPYPKHEN